MTDPIAAEKPTRAGLPHPRFRLPLLGDLLRLDLAKPTQSLVPLSHEAGPVFEQVFFGFPLRVVAGAREIEEVNNEEAWEKHVGPALHKLRPMAGDGLFTAYNREPNWQKAHNVLMPAFSRSAMVNYHASIRGAVEELVEVWAEDARSGAWVDVVDSMNKLTLEVISRAGFGHSFNLLSSREESPLIAAIVRELTYAQRRTDVLPWFERMFLRKREHQHQADMTLAKRTVDDIVGERRRNPHESPTDILDLMLTAVDPETGEQLDDANIRNQILTFLIAGSETSANAVSFALHHLAEQPELARQAQAEVEARWPGRDFPDIGYEDVAKLRYLRRVTDETLRLWPVAPGYFRRARKDTTVGGHAFKQKDWVFVLLIGAHRDPASWGADADRFNPDRFSPENIRSLPPRIYKPFGTGPRACIGRQFALHEIILTLAAILHQFDLEPDPGYTITATEHPTLKPAGLRLRLHTRSR
ncbi:cytochrome P450 [Segniliparus rotundus DSM 44985]|uniref:Cytochrome P450 n=1 Tax=Segniliparus rotundus (strain ATCC BAA-972 / CDC 1076 / CIP 108378 / DSM 44985 / JCM 13578) TaxID=640132 RepID=D6ZBF1_SEGRD|nr:cytochrome P450 [Segniliparus rotundus]ADG98903.1 cytochrome P450 [Segniliparus rotundus DSM 44985]